jgi:1-deoxy-D-xylulose-5-phosphate reductoisomerase
MGRKVTIDSASLMNKALEVIEAHWLFDLPSARIDAIVHPQSVVHSFVEFDDASVIAQLSPPSMKLPIQYALTWPDRTAGCSPSLDWAALRGLDFEPVDHARFPAIRLAHRVIDAGGTAGAVFNAANEEAVEAFVAGRVRFGRIPGLVTEALDALPPAPVRTLHDVLAADAAARAFVRERVAEAAGVAQG